MKNYFKIKKPQGALADGCYEAVINKIIREEDVPTDYGMNNIYTFQIRVFIDSGEHQDISIRMFESSWATSPFMRFVESTSRNLGVDPDEGFAFEDILNKRIKAVISQLESRNGKKFYILEEVIPLEEKGADVLWQD